MAAETSLNAWENPEQLVELGLSYTLRANVTCSRMESVLADLLAEVEKARLELEWVYSFHIDF